MVNFLVAYFLLQAAGLLSSQHAAFSRMVCASGIASLSALILFAPELSYPAQVLYKILTACAVVGVAFGLQGLRRFVTAVCWYAALNILLAGLCIAVILRTGTPLLQTANLTVYLRISPVVLLLLSAARTAVVPPVVDRQRLAPSKMAAAPTAMREKHLEFLDRLMIFLIPFCVF